MQGIGKMDISIIVICYNQEKMIAETLESIKYQLETFPSANSVQLIVADDASKDKTTIVVEKWVEKNRSLFSEVHTIFSKENQGTVANISGALKRATGSHILLMAGDDLLSNIDVLSRYRENSINGIVACSPYCFDGEQVITNSEYYKYVVALYFFPIKYIKRRAKYNCPIINGSIIGRNFFCDEAVEFSKIARLLDDQARYMKAFELIKDIEYSYQAEPILLYRISEGQVTQKPEHKKKIMEDKKKLVKYACGKTKDIFLKYAIWCEYLRMKNNRIYRLFFRFFNVDGYYFQIMCCKNKRKIENTIAAMMEIEKLDLINQYIKDIREAAKEYLV